MKHPFEPALRIELEYQKAVKRVAGLIERGVSRLSSYEEIIRYLTWITQTEQFHKLTWAAASKMVTALFVSNARDWREAASKGTRGRDIHAALRDELRGITGHRVQEIIRRNAELIKSIPLDVAETIVEDVKKAAIEGRRANDIMDDIRQRVPEITDAKARLIGRTEVSKTTTALTRARSESVGLEWYVWRTSEDSRVRHSHEIMDGVLIRWTEAPSPEALANEPKTYGHYHAGEIFNCRCYPEPVINLDRLKWPMKVYAGGRIVKMTRAEFQQIAA